MTTLTDHQLYEAGLSTDEISGFREMLRQRLAKRPSSVLPPEHLRGVRLERFYKGAEIAYYWLTMRNAAGRTRRKHRAEERARTGGMCTVIDRNETKAEAVTYLNDAIASARRSSASVV